MGNSKIIYGDTVLMDLTSDTVTADKLLKGETAHGADGEPITGTYEGGGSVLKPIEFDVYSGSYLAQNNTIFRNNTTFPDYKQIEIDLTQYVNKTIVIKNNGDRNYVGFTAVKPYGGMGLSGSRIETDGEYYTLHGEYDNHYYLVYDFTSSNEDDSVIQAFVLEEGGSGSGDSPFFYDSEGKICFDYDKFDYDSLEVN